LAGSEFRLLIGHLLLHIGLGYCLALGFSLGSLACIHLLQSFFF
jgi:hypothetical protein